MCGVKEPQESYEVTEDGTVLQVTEYGPEDEFLLAQGFEDPNYTQIPNQLLGGWKDGTFLVGQMTDMTEVELKVSLALCRITFGFHRDDAAASLSWLEKATGLSRQGVLLGIERLVKRGLFIKDKSKDGRNLWRKVHGGSQRCRLEVVNVVDQTSQRCRPNKESIKKERKKNPPPKKRADEDAVPPVKEEYVELDQDGYPESPVHPLIKHIQYNAGRNLTPNQRRKLARGVPYHNPEHPSPCTLFEQDTLFQVWVDEKIAWATGGKDGKRVTTGRLVNAIRNYDEEHYGWLNFKQKEVEAEQAVPVRHFKKPDEPSQEDIDWWNRTHGKGREGEDETI